MHAAPAPGDVTPDDDSLLDALGTGGPSVAGSVYDRFHRLIFGVALALTGDHGLAADVVQETMVSVVRQAATWPRAMGAGHG